MTSDQTVYDVLIIGAGPGGISAACVAAESGKRVAVVDASKTPGGQIWRGGLTKARSRDARYWLSRFDSSGAEFLPETQVVALGEDNELVALHKESLTRLKYDSLILATGAREAFIPFPGWTHPGVMGAGGIQAAMKSGLTVRGKRIIIAGTGPLLLAVAESLKSAGADIAAIIEQAPYASLMRLTPDLLLAPSKLIQAMALKWKLLGTPFLTNSYVCSASATGERLAVSVRTSGAEQLMECDILACGYHLTPNLELPRLLNCRIEDGVVQVDDQMRTTRDSIFAVGELIGIGGVECALNEGCLAGYTATGALAQAEALQRSRENARRFARKMNAVFAIREELRLLATDDTVVCRCEDVTHGQLKSAAGWREAKLYTRCGMGPCQGRVCGCVTQVLYGWTQDTVRPPLFPVPATFWTQLDPAGDE